MFKIKDLLMMLDKTFEDPIADLIEKGHIRENVTKPTDLNKQEFCKYVKQRMRLEKQMRNNWLSILLNDCSRFKNPSLINLAEFDDFPPDDNYTALA